MVGEVSGAVVTEVLSERGDAPTWVSTAGGGVASPLGSLVQLMRRDGLDEDDAELAMRAWVGWGSDGPGPLADYDHYAAAWSAAFCAAAAC